MTPDPDTPRVPLVADDPYLLQLEMMAESDPELLTWLEKNVYANPDFRAEPAPGEPTAGALKKSERARE